jgi:hypothetical protein
MTKEQLNEITSWLIDNVFRNPDVMFSDEIEIGDEAIALPDVIATLHNLLYEQITGERYDYMFHWANKVGSDCNDNIFDNMLKGGEK